VKTLAFAMRYLGHQVQAPGGIGGECVDLANLYLLALGHPHVYRNAADWAGMALPGFIWQANSPANYPASGDIAVWHSDGPEGIGANGHIAVVLVADSMQLLTLDQNWSVRVVTLQLHSYAGVAGWHHLRG